MIALRDLTKIVIGIFLILSTSTFAATTQESQPTSDPTKTIMVDQISKQFTLSLPSTPSTGYSWLLKSYNPDFIKLIKHEYVASTQGMPGASGVENWTFKIALEEVAGPQLTKIDFIYARMWEANQPSNKKANFTVVLY